MNYLIQNMPIVWIIFIMLGTMCIIWSVVKIGNSKSDSEEEYRGENVGNKEELKELFSYFLEEEEKKNQGVRNLLQDTININKQTEYKPNQNNESSSYEQNSKNASGLAYFEIMRYYKQGKSEEWIAQKLKKGVGEVKLIISLYNMK